MKRVQKIYAREFADVEVWVSKKGEGESPGIFDGYIDNFQFSAINPSMDYNV